MKHKILIIGIKGMAGHMLYQFFSEQADYEVWGIARNITEEPNKLNLDITDTEALKQIISTHNFTHVVNCIGILNKDAEDHPAKAIWFNSYFPHFLEELTKGTPTKVIHISTDCVFSGKNGGYTEDAPKDGIGYYAQSKALGELDNDKDVTIRMSIIGPEVNTNGIGLFHWFMSQSAEAELKGYTRAYWTGLTTLELAKVVKEIIAQKITGLIQVVPEEKIDKWNLINLFNKIYRNDAVVIRRDDVYNVDKSLKSIRTDFKYEVPTYEEMLNDQKQWMINHSNLYNHYTF